MPAAVLNATGPVSTASVKYLMIEFCDTLGGCEVVFVMTEEAMLLDADEVIWTLRREFVSKFSLG